MTRRFRVVFYARYSDDLQRAESIADQFELCRRYADQQGWDIVGQYDDAARCRQHTYQKPHDPESNGYRALLSGGPNRSCR